MPTLPPTLGLKPYLTLICALVLLPACRSMTVNETAFSNKIYSGVVDFKSVRLQRFSLWRSRTEDSLRKELLADLSRDKALAETITDREAFLDSALEALRSQAEAVVIGNRIFYANSTYRLDFAAGFPTNINVSELALLAHELVHVWQHQNRDRTGYSLLAVALERLSVDRPYEYRIEPGKPFLDYRFEQQGAIMQNYIFLAFSTADPQALRRHRELLEQEFDLQDFKENLMTLAGS